MNKRFDDLRLDAGISRLHEVPYMVAVNKEGEIIEPSEGLQKFAQLIVAECMDVFGQNLPEPGDGRMTDVIDRICRVAEHFGVES